MSNLQEFLAFEASSEEAIADFEGTDETYLIEELFGDRAGEFEVIGMHGSGSLMAIWNVEGQKPVVWVDTDGQASLIASSVDEFLKILPYDTGFIYDLAFSRFKHGPEVAAKQLTDAAQDNPGQPQFIAWLEDRGLNVASDPATIVKSAKDAFPDVSALIRPR